MRTLLTLCFPLREGYILLGMKKRGFGAGRWNGFGGKIEKHETIEEAARREVLEECGLSVETLELAGIHEFEFDTKPGEILEVHVFWTQNFSGEPIETDEMRPEWFRLDEIPYDTMWPDDRYWFPFFLNHVSFRARFRFDRNDVVQEMKIEKSDLQKKQKS